MSGTSTPQSDYTQIIDSICTELEQAGGLEFRIGRVHDHLDDLSKEHSEDATLKALADASAYHMSRQDGQPFACGPFSLMFILPDGENVRVYPIPLGEVKEDVLAIWSAVASDPTLHPMVRSRLADLLWVRRHERDRQWFLVAINSYMALAKSGAFDSERGDGLARAVDICAEARQDKEEALTALADLADEVLRSPEDAYGVVARAISDLVDQGHPCSDLLEKAVEKYGNDPFRLSELCDMAARACQDQDERKNPYRKAIEGHEAAADFSTGLLRLHHLEAARAIARKANFSGEVTRLTTQIERVDVTGDMQKVESSVEIDLGPVQAEVDDTLGGDLPESVLRFGAIVPISPREQVEEHISEMTARAPLQAMIARTILGPDGSTRTLMPGTPERKAYDIGDYDGRSIAFFAECFGSMFMDGLRDRHCPSKGDLVSVFTCAVSSEAIARRIAVSYERWSHGDYTSAVSVIFPLVEQMTRSLCRAIGLAITSTQKDTARVVTLNTLISGLKQYIGPERARYLEAALVDEHALNLRNDLAHALTETLHKGHYIVLFHMVCVLRNLAMGLQAEPPSAGQGSDESGPGV